MFYSIALKKMSYSIVLKKMFYSIDNLLSFPSCAKDNLSILQVPRYLHDS